MPHPLPVPLRQAVCRLGQTGAAAVTIAADLGLSPRTVQRLLQRFRDRGISAVVPSYPHQPPTPGAWATRVVNAAVGLRHQHPRWGAPLIRVLLGHRFAARPLPSARSLQRWFARAGLGPAPKGRHPAEDDRRATRPHAVWQMDACERLRLADGEQASWLRLIDEFSGAILLTVVFPWALFNQVPPSLTQAALRKAFTIWGLPAALRVDNGTPWGSKGDLPTDLALWVSGLGVSMIWNPAHQPRRNGVVERFQGVGRCWLEPETCSDWQQLQRRANRLDRLQREEYPLAGGKARLQVYPDLAHSGRAYNRSWEKGHWDLGLVTRELAGYQVLRRVDSKGMLSLYNRNRYVGQGHAGQAVWVTLDPQLLVWVVADDKGQQLRQLPAPEICQDRIVRLSVSNRRD
jgi:hypothetical protein